jgi:hypothetical protein
MFCDPLDFSPRFGILQREKSGNPDWQQKKFIGHLKRCCVFADLQNVDF